MTNDTKPRKFQMRKPKGYVPAVQRYSSRIADETKTITTLIFGLQFTAKSPDNKSIALTLINAMFEQAGAPLHHEFATFLDPEGYENIFAVCYWHDDDSYRKWQTNLETWLDKLDPANLEYGLWIESFNVPAPYRETLAFKEYLRGLSACPHSKIEPTDESGYWSAARDRFEASAFDDFTSEQASEIKITPNRETFSKRITITDVPEKLCVIRSGVSWENCGEEQLNSYTKNLEPKLDAGMDYLRKNPVETGCCSLRQVEYLDQNGKPSNEAYSLGIFLSYSHLEDWAHKHPTHLAIYTRALAEREKYQDRLELKTYHEIYVLNNDVKFEYLNCHSKTGLLPFFTMNVES